MLEAYDVFAAAADTAALKVVLRGLHSPAAAGSAVEVAGARS